MKSIFSNLCALDLKNCFNERVCLEEYVIAYKPNNYSV